MSQPHIKTLQCWFNSLVVYQGIGGPRSQGRLQKEKASNKEEGKSGLGIVPDLKSGGKNNG